MTAKIEIRAPMYESQCTAALSYWYRRPGDSVHAGDDLLDYETDKATITLESPVDGVLTEVLVQEDGVITPGMLLGYLAVRQDRDDVAQTKGLDIP